MKLHKFLANQYTPRLHRKDQNPAEHKLMYNTILELMHNTVLKYRFPIRFQTLVQCLYLPIFFLLIPKGDAQASPEECGCSSFDVIGLNESSISYISQETITPGYCLDVRGTLYIDEPTIWEGLTVIMKEGSVIIVEDSFTVRNGTHITGCGNMWQGIHTTGVAKLTLLESTIEGAEFGVKLVHLQTFECRDVEFIDDYIGIAAGNPFEEDETTIKILQVGEITGCTFYTDGVLPDPYPTQYYEGEWPPNEGGVIFDKMLAAVFMKNCVGLSLGSLTVSNEGWNEVYEARNGVIILNSTTTIQKTNFHDFTGQFPSSFIHDPGLLTMNQVGIFSEHSITIVEKNKTEDIMVGLWGVESSDYVNKNEFRIYNGSGGLADTKGIHEQRPQDLTIIDNKIFNGYIGIWVDNGTRPFTIKRNVLNRTVVRDNNEGIRVDGNQILGSVTAQIVDNKILLDNSDSSVGISAQFVTGIRMDNNQITFDGTLYAGKHNAGIVLFDATSCILSRNQVYAAPEYNTGDTMPNTLNAGIVVTNSLLTRVHCNEAENFDNDIYLIGPNHMTDLSTNFFSDANRGLEVFGPANLGAQLHKGNEWIGSYNDIGAIITGLDQINTAIFSEFIVDSNDLGGVFLPDSFHPFDWFVHEDGTTLTCFLNTNQFNPTGYDLSKFVRQDIDYQSFDNEMTWLANAGLFDILLKHDSLLSYDPLDSFYKAQEEEVMGDLMEVRDKLSRIPDELIPEKMEYESRLRILLKDLQKIDSIVMSEPIDKLDWLELRSLKVDTSLDTLTSWLGVLDVERGDYMEACDEALTAVSSLTPTNDLEEYLKESLRIKADLILNGQISSSDSIDILVMHDLCPWEGGYSIGVDFDVFAEITDSLPGHNIYPCFSLESITTDADVLSSSKYQVSVSPNPGSDKITIQATSTISELALYDTSLRLITVKYPGDVSYALEVYEYQSGAYILVLGLDGKFVPFKIFIAR